MNIQWKNLITCLVIPLAVGSLSALLTQNSMEAFASVSKPPLSPPGWLFPVVWTILYILMGIASYLMLPYLLWVAFAGYLNLFIAFLN